MLQIMRATALDVGRQGSTWKVEGSEDVVPFLRIGRSQISHFGLFTIRSRLEAARSRHGGGRRSARIREGGERDMAGNAHPALHLPRLLPGEEVHHEPAETGCGFSTLT